MSSTARWPRSCFAWQGSKRSSIRSCSEDGISNSCVLSKLHFLVMRGEKLRLRRGVRRLSEEAQKRGLDCVAQELVFQVNIRPSNETGQSSFVGRKKDSFNRHATKTCLRQWPAIRHPSSSSVTARMRKWSRYPQP